MRAAPTVAEAFLYGLPIAVSLALIYWVLRLLASQARGERLVLRWREMGRAKRTFGVLLLVFMCFNLYLSLVRVLISLGAVTLPFAGTDSPVIMSSYSLSFLGLAYLLSLTHPRKEAFKAKLS